MSASFSSRGGSVCAVVDLGGSGVAGGFTRLMNWIIWLQSSRVPPSQSTARAWHSGLYFWGLIYVCLEKRCRNRTRDGSSRLYSCHGNRAVQEGFIVDQVIGTVAVRTRAVSNDANRHERTSRYQSRQSPASAVLLRPARGNHNSLTSMFT